MERSQRDVGRGRLRKIIREVVKKDLEINNLDKSMVRNRTLWRKLIYVVDPTQCDKAWLLLLYRSHPMGPSGHKQDVQL